MVFDGFHQESQASAIKITPGFTPVMLGYSDEFDVNLIGSQLPCYRSIF
jgi:hypothetical protein